MKTDSTDRALATRGLLRIDEAATYAAIGRTVAYRLIGRGDWPTVMIGRSRRVPLEDLDAWIRANKTTAPPAGASRVVVGRQRTLRAARSGRRR